MNSQIVTQFFNGQKVDGKDVMAAQATIFEFAKPFIPKLGF
jgi:hypothetical protein